MAEDKQREGWLSPTEPEQDGGEPTFVQEEDASGHTRPASESGIGNDDERNRRPNPIAGTILPPD